LSDASIYKCSCSTFVESGFYHKFYLVEQMTQEVLRTEKKAYEKVIRTIAHEVNNSMAGIGSTLDTVRDIVELQEEEESSFDQKSSLSEILTTASARCTSLSRFITNYANVVKIPQPQMEKVSLNEFVKGRYRFFEILCSGKNIKIHLNIAPVTSVVAMDTVLMEQVLLNIVKNSIESIGDADGEIVISTLSGGYSSLSRGDSSMQGGILEIFDNGCGISPDVSDKIFTPFFSTKPNGQGIGLIFIREVLQKHNFRFSLQTTDDNRTCFRIQF
ncbi:MAG: ATP-binding protein, partial [Bacteroidales bacterium]